MSEEKHEHVHKSLKRIFVNNFIGGIAWGLGATVGVAVLLAILGFIFSKVNLVPVIGTFVGQITSFVLQNNPNLLK